MNNFALFFFLSDWRFDLKEKTIYYFTRKLWETFETNKEFDETLTSQKNK